MCPLGFFRVPEGGHADWPDSAGRFCLVGFYLVGPVCRNGLRSSTRAGVLSLGCIFIGLYTSYAFFEGVYMAILRGRCGRAL